MRVRLVVTAEVGEVDEAVSFARLKGIETERFVSEAEGLEYVTLEGSLEPDELLGLLAPMAAEPA